MASAHVLGSQRNTGGIHPAHKRIAQTVRGWFHLPFRSMGYIAEKRRWGTYWNNAQVYTSRLSADEIEPFLADLREYYADQSGSIYLYIDDFGAEAELRPALLQTGWAPEEPEFYLAHVGRLPASSEIPGLEIWPVYEWNLGQFVTTWLRAFGDNEDTPDPTRVREEIGRREPELAGTGRGILARLDGEPAGVIWWHEEPLDIWINQVGTRIPYRLQGIATELVRQCAEDAYDRGYKSVLINVASDNAAALRIYRRLGFRDEVYRYRCYVLD
jgi:GNAT superfamily N-acetyltransferase